MHTFEDTGTAYDTTQCGAYYTLNEIGRADPLTAEPFDRHDVNTGDVFWVPTERVLGVVDTWPFAITKARGVLHEVTNTMEGQRANEDWWKRKMPALQAAGVLLAIKRLGITVEELDDSFLSLQPWMLKEYGFNLERMPGSGESPSGDRTSDPERGEPESEEDMFTTVANALGLTTEEQQRRGDVAKKLRFGVLNHRTPADPPILGQYLTFPDTIEMRLGISLLMQVSLHDLNHALEEEGECETNEHFCDFVPA